ncbi:hypothetical protein AYK86_05275 [Acinetobacter venetianus]|uniref:hypothetical protein n=1 Tax=Acinetobacter venetianus TaxID=52133 RepID=UPI000775F100|nr:hypothetical protein [Acinetobacter venetianus]KXO85611.1 hypothetical protein AYK86_05275 [Acinetobacter venetianus]
MVGFVAGTLVHTERGLVPIQEIKVGDRVLSRPECGGEDVVTEYKRVTRAFCSGKDTIVQIPHIRESNPDLINILYMTDHYPVWLENKKEWSAAIDLVTSDKLALINSDDFSYVWKPSEVFRLRLGENISNYGACNGLGEEFKYGSSVLLFDGDELSTFNIDDYGYCDQKYVDGFAKSKILKNNILENKFERLVIGRFKLPVYNIEVEDYQTFFVSKAGLWVHC